MAASHRALPVDQTWTMVMGGMVGDGDEETLGSIAMIIHQTVIWGQTMKAGRYLTY